VPSHRRRDIASGFDARQTFELGVWSVIRLCLHPPSYRARRPSPERYLAGADALHRRRPHRTRQQYGRTINPWHQAQSQERALCRVRRRSRTLGVASLTETCKLKDVDPLAYFTDVLTRIVNGHPNRDIDQLLPWAYREQSLKWPENDAYDRPMNPPKQKDRRIDRRSFR
jgi:hypothetical protein